MRLFVYGSLMVPQVCKRVIGRVPQARSATLDKFARYRVTGTAYPGIVPAPHSQVSGRILYNLSEMEIMCLDRFEGAQYERKPIFAVLENGSHVVADSYVFKDEWLHELSPEPWCFELFLKNDLDAFLRTENS